MNALRFSLVAALLALIHASRGAPPANLLRDANAESAAVRARALELLARHPDPAVVPVLTERLKDPEPAVRRAAAKALVAVPDHRATAPLAEALRDKDVNVRFYAAHALGEIRDPRAAEALLRALEDREWTVRDQAAWALRELGPNVPVEPLVARLSDPGADAKHLRWILRRTPPEALAAALGPLLKSDSPATRGQAVTLLAELPAEAAIPALLSVLADPDPRIRLQTVQALGVLGDRTTAKAVRKLAGDPDPRVRTTAAEVAGKLSKHPALVGLWTFDDIDGTVARDESGGGSDGSIIGCRPVPGKRGRALEFGEGKYVELGQPNAIPVQNTLLTVAARVRTDADAGVVVARGGAFAGFSLYVKDGVPRFGIHREKDGPTYIATGTEPLPKGRWVELAGVIREKRIDVLMDGNVVGTAETPGPIPVGCGQGMEFGFDVGNSPAEIVDPFVGAIDEVRIYADALSPQDLAAEMQPEE